MGEWIWMVEMAANSCDITAKLRKLSKEDLIWCILEMEKHNLGFPSISSILSDLEYKKTVDNIGRCEKLAKQAHEKRMAYNDLIAPYVGKPIIEVPKQVFDRAVELLREADAADEEWFRLNGIRRKKGDHLRKVTKKVHKKGSGL